MVSNASQIPYASAYVPIHAARCCTSGMARVATVRLLPDGRGIRWPAGQVLPAGFSQDYSAPDFRFVPHFPLALSGAGSCGELN